MRALQFSATGTLDSLRVVDLPLPQKDHDEVVVEVRATGVNPSDVKNVLGRFPYTTVPRIPGRDFAGVVVEGPTALLGKAVWGGTGAGFGFLRDGCHAQYVTLPAQAVALKPESLSFAQAATCGVPYITAFDALERAGVGTGTRLLIIGAGAVAQAAYALAVARGADAILMARREEVVCELDTAGVRAFQLPAAEQLPEHASRHFNGQAPEVVFDTTGAWLPAAVNSVAAFGRIVVIAAPVDGLVNTPVLNLYRRGGSIVGVNSLLYTVEECARMLERIGALFDQGALPLPDQWIEMPLAKGVEAYRSVDSGIAQKIVLVP